ncbi:glycosyltransferase family 87 protein [Occallatibacter savannae]|uniref:glycosyltransferase family 87 protein n=1 Tax=Occallatibacter savannae TaxID=1002691 RepID=UPI001EF6F16E|nr:glycosyltransferase family 87 protein [Occallatibacter savannae]
MRNAERNQSTALKLSDKVLLSTVILVAGAAAFLAAFTASYALPVQDLAQYWAAAHLLHSNPYSAELTSTFERGAGILSTPLITKMPPWAIVTFLPLGLLDYHASFALWTVASVLVIGLCSYVIGSHLQQTANIALPVLPFIFGPTVVLLMLGQYTVFTLLGSVLFCSFAASKRESLAGASLLLVLGKPHITILFLISIACWIIHRRRWAMLASGSIVLATTSLLATAINRHVFQQFLHRSSLVVHETEAYPNLGGILYSLSGNHSLALLPQAAGLLWLGFYWMKNREEWNWRHHGPVVLMVSVVCSYYSYPYDQILCLPALITAYAYGNRRAFLLAFAVTDLGFLAYLSNAAGHFGFGYMFLWWTGLGWLVAFSLANTGLPPIPAGLQKS